MIKATIEVKNNVKVLAEGAKEKKQYRKILTEVGGLLVPKIKSKAPVKNIPYSSGRSLKGGGRVRQPAGNLKDSIGVFDSVSTNYVRVWVGARVRDGFDGWYAQMVHDGHKVYNNPLKNKDGKSLRSPLKRWRNKRIPEKTTGYVAPNTFISTPFNANRNNLESVLKNKVGTNLETLIKQQNNV